MSKPKKPKIRQSVKTIKVDDRLITHKLASAPYKIFCESFSSNIEPSKCNIEATTPLVEVLEYKNHYLFFDNFKTISSLSEGSKLFIRRIDISDTDIEMRCWKSLLNHLEVSEPLNLDLLHSFKNSIPKHIQESFFGGSFTIQHLLDKRGMPRHKYDYILQKHSVFQTHQVPYFSDLIKEARNHDSS